MTVVEHRRYQMWRVGPSDWVCPANDLRTMWRFHVHRDGTAYGAEHVRYQDRPFWRAVWRPLTHDMLSRDAGGLRAEVDMGDPWERPWREEDWYLSTRAEAINVMLARYRERGA